MYGKKLFIVGILSSFSTLFSCQPKEKFASMDVEEFAACIQDGTVQRLDVRTLAEYSEGHIPQTVNIDVQGQAFATTADSLLRKDKPVALYCRSGKRSKKAAQILSDKGYKVFELDKGFLSWEEAGKTIEK